MAVAYAESSAVKYLSGATINTTPNAPATINAGDLLVIIVGVKPDTSTVNTPSGWARASSDFSGGGGTTGIDTGPTRVVAFFKEAAGGDAMPTINITSTNVSWATVHRFTKGSGTWDYAVAGGVDSTTGTAWSVTCGSNPGLEAGDVVLVSSVIPTDVTTPAQFSAESVSATGVSAWSAFTEIDEPDTNVGNDIGGFEFYGSVTTGTATAAPVITATAGGTTTNVRGPSILVRLREVTSGDATFTTSAGAATGNGGSSTFTGAATFSTTVAAALANGGPSTFTAGATFTTNAGAATANGGSTAFTGGASFSTLAGAALANGGSSTFTGGATFGTTAGAATAQGGSSTFTGGAGGGGTFTTAAGSALASGGSTAFTGDAAFTTNAGAALANGGSSTLTGGGTFSATAGAATANGGSSSFTGAGTFGTAAGAALAGGGSSSFTGGAGGPATFTTLAGAALASGASSAFSGGAALGTLAATALAGGGVATFTGAAVFATAGASAIAAGGVSSFVGLGEAELGRARSRIAGTGAGGRTVGAPRARTGGSGPHSGGSSTTGPRARTGPDGPHAGGAS